VYKGDITVVASTDIPLPTGQHVANCRWICDHIDDLVEQYPDQWIAVHEGRVLAAGRDLGEVAAAARAKSHADDIVFDFVNSGSMIFEGFPRNFRGPGA
jgi:hypothetical protein